MPNTPVPAAATGLPNRRAILTGIPAAAIGVGMLGAGIIATSAALVQTPMAGLVAEVALKHRLLHDIPDDEMFNLRWNDLCAECIDLRRRLIAARPTSAEDFWLKVNATRALCGDDFDPEDEIEAKLTDGHSDLDTLELSIYRDLIRLRPTLTI